MALVACTSADDGATGAPGTVSAAGQAATPAAVAFETTPVAPTQPPQSPTQPPPEPTALPATAAPARTSRPLPPLAAVQQVKRAGPMDVTLVVLPGRAGYNEVNFYFFDPEDRWTAVESADVRFVFLDFGGVTFSENAAPLHPGHVVVGGTQMQHPGRWRIEATFKGPGFDGARVEFEVLVP
jgi:hypothetical protein